MSKRVLGLDISTSTIGWGLLEIDEDIKYLDSGYFKPIIDGSIVDRIVNTREKIQEIINKTKPDYIGIEDLIKFMPASTATTVVMLTTFNRMVCLVCYDYLGVAPELLNVLTIRHSLKFDVLPKKEEMPELVAKHLKITFPYQYLTKGKNKGSIKKENYDVADGIAVALAYAFKLTNRIKPKKVKKKK